MFSLYQDLYKNTIQILRTINNKNDKEMPTKGPWQSSHPGDEAVEVTLYCTQPVVNKNLSFLGSLEMENQKNNPKSHLV